MAVGFLRGRVGGGADVRHEQRRMDGARGLAQIAIVPGRMHAAIAKWRFQRQAFTLAAIPAQAEAIAVGGGGAQPRVQALVDQGVLGLEKHALHLDGTTGIGQPTTHDALLFSAWIPRPDGTIGVIQCRSSPRNSTSAPRAATSSTAPSTWPCVPSDSWRP
ncbi:hypothetical protein D9M68_751850 [compost metagenome]